MVLATVPLLRLVIIGIALLLALPIVIEPSWQNMAALLGTAGLALGFALKDYVSSLIAGVVSAEPLTARATGSRSTAFTAGRPRRHAQRGLVTPDDDYVTIPHPEALAHGRQNANNGPVCNARRCFTSTPTTMHARRRRRWKTWR